MPLDFHNVEKVFFSVEINRLHILMKTLVTENIVITLLKRILIICKTSYYVDYETHHQKNINLQQVQKKINSYLHNKPKFKQNKKKTIYKNLFMQS